MSAPTRPQRPWRRTPPPSRHPAGSPAACTVVVDELLHAGGVLVFRGHDAAGDAVRCVVRRDVMRPPVAGETWEVTGRWQYHADHGDQVGDVAAAALVRPSGRLFLRAVAQNTRDFPGIGEARAAALWREHGASIFDLLDAGDPAPLVPQLGPELADVLIAGWRALDHVAKAYRWLTHNGFPPGLAATAIRVYSAVPVPDEHAEAAARVGRVVWHLEDDPYRMIAFASWKQTDAAADRLRVGRRDPRRLVGAAEAVCAKALAQGHTWVAEHDLVTGAARLLGLGADDAREGARLAVEGRALVAHAGGYQAPGAWLMERFVRDRVRQMRTGAYVPEQIDNGVGALSHAEVMALLDAYDRTQPFDLSDEQRASVWMAVTEPVSLLLGGPGVGKTTVLQAVHYVARHQQIGVRQAALAGRAAKRMRQATKQDATTIAGLLNKIAKGDVTLDDRSLVVIDEASMVDLATVYRLLRLMPPGARLLLVGDPGQLAPIGFGLVFHVLAAEAGPDAVPRSWLTVPRRQTGASGIPRICDEIRRGVAPALAAPDWTCQEGVSFIDVPPAAVTRTVVETLARLGPAREVLVVGSVKGGPGGVTEINYERHRLHAAGNNGPQINGDFFRGEPVLVVKNEYDLELMNGDLGVALADEPGGALRCRFDDEDKVLPAAMLLRDVELGFAITTHKAQGSQFPVVVVPVTPNALLDRTLLLTAVSRAQEQVILVGDRAGFDEAVLAPPKPDRRRVGLGR